MKSNNQEHRNGPPSISYPPAMRTRHQQLCTPMGNCESHTSLINHERLPEARNSDKYNDIEQTVKSTSDPRISATREARGGKCIGSIKFNDDLKFCSKRHNDFTVQGHHRRSNTKSVERAAAARQDVEFTRPSSPGMHALDLLLRSHSTSSESLINSMSSIKMRAASGRDQLSGRDQRSGRDQPSYRVSTMSDHAIPSIQANNFDHYNSSPLLDLVPNDVTRPGIISNPELRFPASAPQMRHPDRIDFEHFENQRSRILHNVPASHQLFSSFDVLGCYKFSSLSSSTSSPPDPPARSTAFDLSLSPPRDSGVDYHPGSMYSSYSLLRDSAALTAHAHNALLRAAADEYRVALGLGLTRLPSGVVSDGLTLDMTTWATPEPIRIHERGEGIRLERKMVGGSANRSCLTAGSRHETSVWRPY